MLGVTGPGRRDGGALVVPARIARTGVQDYVTHREYRPAEEVFAPESLKSFDGAPVVIGHAPGFVTMADVQSRAVGYVRNVRRDGIYVAADLVIFDEGTVGRLVAGATPELSAGYDVDLKDTPGTYDGQAYDAVQTQIRINHVAIVAAGRCGPGCAIA